MQGVYAVLPLRSVSGMSFDIFFLTPGFADRYLLKTVAQRSLDPKGGPMEVARNATGLRFIPHGDKLLLFGEVGYQRPATAEFHEIWFRTGYMHNSTPYTNLASGSANPGIMPHLP